MYLFCTLFLTSVYAEDSLPSIPYETYKLENGLNVILSPDHSTPSVQVNIWYGVGSKDEVEGLSGFAHLFEHLMFQGSQHYDQEYFHALEEIGAQVNGTTSFDRTNYYEGIPAHQLPLAISGYTPHARLSTYRPSDGAYMRATVSKEGKPESWYARTFICSLSIL